GTGMRIFRRSGGRNADAGVVTRRLLPPAHDPRRNSAMRKLGMLLVVSAVACALHATARPAAAQSPPAPSLPAYRAEEELKGKLTLTGSHTMAQVATVWVESFKQYHPDVQIDVQVKGAVESVNAVTAGEAQIGLLSRTMLQSEAVAFQKKHGHPPVVLIPMY